MIRFFIFLAFLCSLHAQCESKSGKRTNSLKSNVVRGKVLESNTIIPVTLTEDQLKVLRPLDSVRVNMDTHLIDDTAKYSLLVVLYDTKD